MTDDADRLAYYTRYKDRLIFAIVMIALGAVTLTGIVPDLRDPELVGALLLALGGLVLGVVWRGLSRRMPRLVLTEDGVWYKDWGIPAVPWRAITRAHIAGGRTRRNVALLLRDPEGFLGGLEREERNRLERSGFFHRATGNLLIGAAVMDVASGELLDQLRYILEGREEGGRHETIRDRTRHP